jgi:GNAT superfamily N-acetyltransferase
MTLAEYKILKYHPDLHEEILDLQSGLWGDDIALNANYLAWKYTHNPYLQDTPPIYVAIHEGKVVGMRGFFCTQWQRGNSPTLHVLSAADMFVHPDHRRRGIFQEMTVRSWQDFVGSAYALVINLSSGAMSAPGYQKLGWQQMDVWQGTVRSVLQEKAAHPSATTGDRRSLSLRIFNKLSSMFGQLQAPAQQINIFDSVDREQRNFESGSAGRLRIEKNVSPEAMAALVKRVKSEDRIHQVKDASYFAWRFQNPFSRYRFLLWEENGLEGYLVLQQWVNRRPNQINIVDWEVSTPEVLESLLQAITQAVTKGKLIFWSVRLPKESELLLHSVGFTLSNEKNESEGSDLYCSPILLKPLSQDRIKETWELDTDELFNVSNWDFRGINSDYY